jgi:hypothetical protein
MPDVCVRENQPLINAGESLAPGSVALMRLDEYSSRVLIWVVATLVEHPHFRPWLAELPGTVAAKVVDGIEYLREHERGAALPLVRHRLQISRHFPDMSEVRAHQVVGERRYVMRVLVCFVDNDRTLLVCIGGNKAGYEERVGRDWLRRLRAGG